MSCDRITNLHEAHCVARFLKYATGYGIEILSSNLLNMILEHEKACFRGWELLPICTMAQLGDCN